MPSATTTSRWKPLHGSRSRRAGTSVCVRGGAIGSEETPQAVTRSAARQVCAPRWWSAPSHLIRGRHDRQHDGGPAARGRAAAAAASSLTDSANSTTFAIILSLSFCHLLNDMMQSLVPAIYPILKDNYALSFGQVGLITLAFQFTASMLQPVVGMYTDRQPQPYSLMVGMGFTLVGLLLLSHAHSYPVILLAAALIGMGSSVFHPEASRVARMASGGRYGLAQSLFQVGGNLGSASGPLLAAFIVVPRGQPSLLWFSGAALVAMVVLFQVGHWYARAARRGQAGARARAPQALGRRPWPVEGRVVFAVASWSCCCSPRTSTRRASAPTTPST